MCENGVYSFHRLITPSTAAAVPLPRRGRSLGRGIGRWQNVGGRALRELLPPSADGPPSLEEGGLGGGGESGVGGMSAEIATVRCICNAGLHHCNGWMHLQPSVASPYSVGARIARPFIPDVITTLREGARRVIGATAKPLYAIDGKAEGLDRRTPRPPSSREGDRPQAVEGVIRRWKEFPPEGAQPHFRTQGL